MNSSRRPFIIFGIVIATAIILRMIYWLSPMTEYRVVIRGQSIVVDVVRDEETRRQGLSGRVTLAEDHGMLFIFPEKDVLRFWMKDMVIPLDMIWIDDGKIIDITPRIPVPAFGVLDAALPFYAPKIPAKMVLEVNAGSAERFGWRAGDAVTMDI
ncbi:MAG: DUF192 domain-containing protein [bacterium]|nr:DUF192 domain-containing protein [bacterium]